MSAKYFPAEFENKWILDWEKEQTYKVNPNFPPKADPPLEDKAQSSKSLPAGRQAKSTYVLSMFPYPSGAGLHVGHVRIYTGTDILARYFRMKGHSVLHPMGWDAFGLPAENAAIAAKKNPIDMVPEHIANFKRQMQMMGFSYDWSREFSTTDPEYYKWTQWLFIQFYKAGLLYKKNTDVNFCPKCKTGLAEEEVTSEGTHERCGTPITKKMLPQWMFKITDYADRLLADLRGLDWPKGVLEMQKNWIGRSEGVEIDFKVEESISINSKKRGLSHPRPNAQLSEYPLRLGRPPGSTPVSFIKVFSTRPDTILGVSFLAISPEKAKELLGLEWKPGEKTGEKTDLMAENPANGEKIPVYVAEYVLGEVGTGAIMGVPAYDERDAQFAKAFNLPINKAPLTDKKFGEAKIKYKLRDWIFSRQRYWGEPIPMIFCAECAKNQRTEDRGEKLEDGRQRTDRSDNRTIGQSDVQSSDVQTIRNPSSGLSEMGWFPVSDEDLPVELPYVKSYEVGEDGESPLAKIKDWVEVKCPECGGPAKRETDTMPNWAGSCWYYLYFARKNKGNPKSQALNPKQFQNSNDQKSKNLENLDLFRIWNLEFRDSGNSWLPVDWYIGGAEHAVLHLLYARFWAKALMDLGLVDFTEPFTRLRNVGIVLAEDHRKMSKSFGNVINPDDVVKEYGADTLRVYESFMAPFDGQVEWSTKAVAGSYRFLQRIWQIYHDSANITNQAKEEDKELVAKLQRLILKISSDITNVKFNTCISGFMEFLNDWEKKKLSTEKAKIFLKLLAPFAPFITEEIWREVFGEKESIHLASWPEADSSSAEDQVLKIPVQVDGKMRSIIMINDQLNEEKVVEIALKDEKIKKWVEGKKYEVIYVEGKILNLVTGN